MGITLPKLRDVLGWNESRDRAPGTKSGIKTMTSFLGPQTLFTITTATTVWCPLYLACNIQSQLFLTPWRAKGRKEVQKLVQGHGAWKRLAGNSNQVSQFQGPHSFLIKASLTDQVPGEGGTTTMLGLPSTTIFLFLTTPFLSNYFRFLRVQGEGSTACLTVKWLQCRSQYLCSHYTPDPPGSIIPQLPVFSISSQTNGCWQSWEQASALPS